MNWYALHNKSINASEIIEFLRKKPGINAFTIKIEKWYSIHQVKRYVIKDLNSDIIMIQSDLKYDAIFKICKTSLQVNSVNWDGPNNLYKLTDYEQEIMKKLVCNDYVIRHSVGRIVNSHLIVESGPLFGLEAYISKIDRHHRLATLNVHVFQNKLNVALEVLSKS